jgi:UDP-N-acetylmuramoyl-tripeptide--D-alanyl-D-alanine ligase
MKAFFRSIIVFLLTVEAKAILKKYKPELTVVTGSVGKTSTKDAIYTVLKDTVNVRKSEKSLNSDIGVPLTIIGAQNAWWNPFGWLRILCKGLMLLLWKHKYPEHLILEIGADHPGDVKNIAKWIVPYTIVITGVSDIPAHIAYFKSVEEVFEEKTSLLKSMKPHGIPILNVDDERLRELAKEYKGRATLYGIKNGEIRPHNIKVKYVDDKPAGMEFEVRFGLESARCEFTGVIGEMHILPILVAFDVAFEKGIQFPQIAEKLKKHVAPPGRMRLLDGVHNSTIIDDSYNSSPAAAIAALETLGGLEAKRHIAVLGDMRELGEYGREAHEMVGKRAAEIVDLLVTVGEESRVLADAARAAGLSENKIRTFGYGEAEKAGKELARLIQKGDIILVKGSQNRIRLERCVEKIMAEPSRAKELLVRQEPEWLKII